jgi:hypothetical protein
VDAKMPALSFPPAITPEAMSSVTIPHGATHPAGS